MDLSRSLVVTFTRNEIKRISIAKDYKLDLVSKVEDSKLLFLIIREKGPAVAEVDKI